MTAPSTPHGLVRVWDLESRLPRSHTATWDVYKRSCGCSVACVWDVGDPLAWRFFTDADEHPYGMEGLSETLQEADLVVGYNTMGFDNYVLYSMVPTHRVKAEVDLYQHVIKPATRGRQWEEGDWSLDSICTRTLGIGKTRSGAMAPTLSRTNRLGELFTYNMRDVALAGTLFMHMVNKGYVVGPGGDEFGVEEVLFAAIERARARATADAS